MRQISGGADMKINRVLGIYPVSRVNQLSYQKWCYDRAVMDTNTKDSHTINTGNSMGIPMGYQ